MLFVWRNMSVILTLLMFVCEALSFGIPAESNVTNTVLPFQTGLLGLNEDGRTNCNSGGEAGICYDPFNCLKVSGLFGNDCPGGQGVCCLFYRQCGQRSSQEVSYFQRLDEAAATGSRCNYKVMKRSPRYCAMRVNLEELELPRDCQTSINIEGFYKENFIGTLRFPERDLADVICSTETGKEYTFDIHNVDEVLLNVESSGDDSGRWKIKVTQVHCREVDAASERSGNIPAVWSTKLRSSPITPKPTAYSRCGEIGPSGKKRFNLRKNINNITDEESKHFIENIEEGNHSHNNAEFAD
ncbi:unnamed protein product, partial [Meganyctiphanes norvegica]